MGGRLVAERYRLEEQVGAGGMGIVWRATDLELGRTVALKRSQSGDSGQIRREARIGAGLQHPNVVSVYDAVTYEDDRWLVMEYLPSRSLATILETEGVLSHEDAARIGEQLAKALAAMHDKGIVHRDIKPGNVLVAEDGTAKLTDLGIARWADETRTETGLIGGTPAYLAPEVADGHDGTRASDVFSLGATLFAAVEGGSPWGDSENTPLRQLRRAASFQLEPPRKAGVLTPVLTEMLREKPAARPSAREAVHLLGEAGGETTVPARRALRRRRQMSRRVLVVGAVVLVAVLVAGLMFALRGGGVSADTVGDQRTADPCSLIDLGVLAKQGQVFSDPDYGNFNGCSALIKVGPEEDATVNVRVEIRLRGEEPPPPKLPEPGRIGIPDRPAAANHVCARTVWLPDGNLVYFETKLNSDWYEDLCKYAEPLVDGALAVLNKGQIPRRHTPPAPGSLASVDACSLVDSKESARQFGGGRVKVVADFGNWRCFWTSQNRELTIEYSREWWPLNETDDGKPFTLGGRTVFVETGSAGWVGACKAEMVHRRFQDLQAEQKEWVETVLIHLDQKGTDGQTHCEAAKKVAQSVAARLPAI